MDQRLDKIFTLLFNLASGKYDARETISDQKDELDAIITGINMLAEELEATTLSRNYLKSIFDGIVDMVFVINEQGIIENINDAVKDRLRVDDEQLIGKSCNVIFKGKKDFNFKSILQIIHKKQKISDIENSVITEDNEEIPVSCSFSYIKTKDRRRGLILLILKDTTIIKKAEKELRVKNQELNTFIYRASHDLKGPLASMIGLINLIDIQENDFESLKNYFNLIKTSAIKLNGVVSELLDLGRITASDYHYEEIFVNDIIENILNEIKYIPDIKEIHFDIHNSQTLPLLSEPRLIKSCIHNLLENSVKYRNPNHDCLIKIQIKDCHKGIKVIIEDNGIGIKKEIQDKVFNMFYRGTLNSSGSGLGLYIVKTGIEKLEGEISLTSQLGVGTKVSLFIPNRRKNSTNGVPQKVAGYF